jgi:hypothetical protein
MKIQDLSKALDTKTLQRVRGGDNGNAAVNTAAQLMNLSVPVASLSSGPSNTSVHVNGTQNSQIWNSQFGGDSFLALLPTI